MPKCYIFDIDDTMETSKGPVTVQSLRNLRAEGHIVGLCGGLQRFLDVVPDWWTFISVTMNFDFGHPDVVSFRHGFRLFPKEWWLDCFKKATYTKADEYIMVGNVWGKFNSLGVMGGSHDSEAAAAAGWRFISEDAFAAGVR